MKVGDQLGHVEYSSYILTDRSTEIKRHSIVPVRLICLTLFYFKKRKQDRPLQFIKEVELLKETETRKELSTSTEVEGEGVEDRMVWRATGKPIRQDTKTVSRPRFRLDLQDGCRCTMSLENCLDV